jgi:hypothetical protein
MIEILVSIAAMAILTTGFVVKSISIEEEIKAQETKDESL